MVERIIIADDHPIFREGMRRIVQRSAPAAEIVEVGTASDLERVVARFDAPSLFVLDLMFPGFDGAAGVLDLRRRFPLSSLVVVSMADDRDTVDAVMTAGANGFIGKAVSPSQMSSALAAILAGDIVVQTSDSLTEPAASPGGRLSKLSPRQREVLKLLGLGRSNKEIARELGLSPFTVRIHVSALLKALGVATRAAAAAVAADAGLV